MNQQQQQPPTSEQANNGNQDQQAAQRIVLQPQQIHSLTESYRAEIAKANEVGNQTEEGQKHLNRARRIRIILLRFQEQQRLQRQQQLNGGTTGQPGSVGTPSASQQGSPVVVQQQQPAPVSRQLSLQNVPQQSQLQRQQLPQQQQQQQQQSVNQAGRQTPSLQLQFQSRQGSQNAPIQQQGQPLQLQLVGAQLQSNASILQLQKIRKILDDFHGRLRAIENTKRSGTLSPEELARLVQQEDLLKQRYDQYTRAAVQMSQQFQLRRAQLAAAGNALLAGSSATAQSLQLKQGPSAAQQVPLIQQQQLQQQLARASFQRSNSQLSSINPQIQQQQQQQQMLLIRLQQQQQAAAVTSRSALQSPVNQQQLQLPDNNNAKRVNVNSNPLQRTPASTGRSASPGQSSTPVTAVNALARPSTAAHGQSGLGSSAVASVVKSPVPTIPISSTINVQPPAPTVMKGSRPSVTGGGAFNSLAVTQPATYKLPQFEMEGDRVLHKRKLKELVRSVGSDEGDGETTIDGEVEELLLDLADEFVSNVTSFACRLAKHRKVDNIDVKDIQLHLEKNWNIRIPGYSSDEIRSTRRFQPTAGHNQKIAGVEIARSVKKDGN